MRSITAGAANARANGRLDGRRLSYGSGITDEDLQPPRSSCMASSSSSSSDEAEQFFLLACDALRELSEA